MVDVEEAFSEFVPSFGGCLVADLVGKSPPFSNADFLFDEAKAVVELKRLVEDKSEDVAIKNEIQAKFDAWIGTGTIAPIYGRVRVDSKSLPLHCQRELIDVYRPPIQKRIIKANKQIKATQQGLSLEGYKGILLLVNDGNYALESDAVLYLVGRVLGRNFKHINSVLYCTVNMFATAPMTQKPALIWAHATRTSVAEPMSDEWCMAFFRAWSAHLSQYLGAPIDEVLMPDPGSLEHIRYVRET